MMNIQQHIPTACLCLLCFVGGCMAGDYHADKESIAQEEKQALEVKSDTKTEIVYVPKKTVNGKKEKTDLQADIGKADFTIKVNGQEKTFVKTDDERFMFDKNKLALSQTSRIAIDVNVPPIDNTKRWAVGVGYADGGGIAYTVDFPIGKSDRLGGWVYGSADEKAVGVKMRF